MVKNSIKERNTDVFLRQKQENGKLILGLDSFDDISQLLVSGHGGRVVKALGFGHCSELMLPSIHILLFNT